MGKFVYLCLYNRVTNFLLVITVEVALKTIQEVLSSDDFKVGSQSATRAMETAKKVIDWTGEERNIQQFEVFCEWIMAQFEECFTPKRSLKAQEENLWRKYHQLRVSATFRLEWDQFLMESIQENACPTFYQYVTHRMFRDFVRKKHLVTAPEAQQASAITHDEENVVRYISGYICRKVQNKFASTRALQNKEEMLLFMSELNGDEWNEERGTEEWVNSIDRGGLWHVKDDTYQLFYLMEEDIRKYLLVSAAKSFDETTKAGILASLFSNEDLLFHWTLLASNLEDSIAMHILKEIAGLYVTVRGFGFASSCMELYKQRHQIKIQKSKALRKKLVVNNA